MTGGGSLPPRRKLSPGDVASREDAPGQVASRGVAAGRDTPRHPPLREGAPQDVGLDRRAFVARMGMLGALAAAGGCAGGAVGAHEGVLRGGEGRGGGGEGAEVDPSPGRAPDPARADDGRGAPRTLDAFQDPSHPFWEAAREGRRSAEAALREPWRLTAWEARSLLMEQALEPEVLLEASLRRIRSLDAHLLAFNTLSEAEARRQLREGGGQGLLGGIPVAIKDNVHTAGVRTTANAHMFADFVPTRDATLVRRLLEAGALAVGKTQMGPLATTRALTPDGEVTTLNAWAPGDPRVSPGGSSSGSATAVAARMTPLAVGTQTGGSITVPASSQGLTGLKPTMGRVSLDGVIPLTYTRDHPGPLARDARDAALFLQVVAGPDPRDPRTLGLPEVPDYLLAATPLREHGRARMRWETRLGIPPGWAEGQGPGAGPGGGSGGAPGGVAHRRAFLDAMERGGVRVVEVPLPAEWGTLTSGAMNAGRLPERSEPFLPWLREDVRLFGVTLSSWIQGLLLPADAYLTAQRGRMALLSLVLDQLLDRCDALVLTNHLAFDMVGLPLVTFPLGFRAPGEGAGGGVGPLPEGVLLGGLPFGEERLLALAALWQDGSDAHRQSPPDPLPGLQGLRRSDRGRLDLEAVASLSE